MHIAADLPEMLLFYSAATHPFCQKKNTIIYPHAHMKSKRQQQRVHLAVDDVTQCLSGICVL